MMSSAVFELESSACAICPFSSIRLGSEEHDSHSFLVGTSNCFGDNKISIIIFQEDSNSIVSFKSWKISNEVRSLSAPLQSSKSFFSAIFSSSAAIFEIVDDERKLITSLDSPYFDILWPNDKHNRECVATEKQSIVSINLDDGRCGSESLLYRFFDRRISCVSLDPFHLFSCLCGTNNGLSLIDFRSGKEELLFNFISHGLNSLECVNHSPVSPGRFLTSGKDGIIRVYDNRMNSVCCVSSLFSAHGHTVHKCLFNPFYDMLLISCSSDQSVRLWDLSKKVEQTLIQSTSEFQDSVVNLCWSDTSPWIYAGLSFNGKVVLDTVMKEKKMAILLEEDI